MRTFLRKIRKSLIESSPVKALVKEGGSVRKTASPVRLNGFLSGQTGRYMLYAIGEIVLVVIGILIALQINNWNERQKNIKEETYYLKELKNDFESNKITLENGETEILNRLDEIVLTESYMFKRLPDTVSTYSLLHPFYGLSVPDLEFAEGALNELVNTGKLHLIRNRKLRRDLSNWNNKVDKANVHLSKMLKFKEDQLRPYIIDCCPMGEVHRKKHLKVFRDNKFQTILNLYQKMLNTQMTYKRDPINELIDRILIEIEVELNPPSRGD